MNKKRNKQIIILTLLTVINLILLIVITRGINIFPKSNFTIENEKYSYDDIKYNNLDLRKGNTYVYGKNIKGKIIISKTEMLIPIESTILINKGDFLRTNLPLYQLNNKNVNINFNARLIDIIIENNQYRLILNNYDQIKIETKIEPIQFIKYLSKYKDDNGVGFYLDTIKETNKLQIFDSQYSSSGFYTLVFNTSKLSFDLIDGGEITIKVVLDAYFNEYKIPKSILIFDNNKKMIEVYDDKLNKKIMLEIEILFEGDYAFVIKSGVDLDNYKIIYQISDENMNEFNDYFT